MKKWIIIWMFWTVLPLAAEEVTREISIQEPFLVFPVRNDAEMRWCEVWVAGRLEHRFQIALADTMATADWWSYLDVREYSGKKITLQYENLPIGSQAPQCVRNMREVPRKEPLYNETLRPQLRFSQKQGWNNDPNGMVYHEGVYHLFWQSNPFGLLWGNMYWGHATSTDLVHWTEHALVLRPFGGDVPLARRNPAMTQGQCFSGSANVAHDLPLGDPRRRSEILAMFTDTACGEALAISSDAGEHWTYCEGNPIIPHKGRDPKLIWMPEEKCWVVAVYDEENGQKIAFYRSTDRKNWERTGEISGFYECPEMFRLPVEGTNESRWVLFAADAFYFVGQFDGKTFVPEHEEKHRLHYGKFYASQCFSNLPNGRVVQIGWAQIDMGKAPGQVFNQGFTLPLELTLKKTADGIRLFANPIQEIMTLRQEKRELSSGSLDLATHGDGQLYDILVTVERDATAPVTLRFGTNTLVYNPEKRTLGEMPLSADSETPVTFRVIVDRPLFEVCGNAGAVYSTQPRTDGGKPLGQITLEGPARAEIWFLRSIHR